MPVQIDYEQLTKVTQQDLDEGVWGAEHKIIETDVYDDEQRNKL